jgi:hypothetical protein
MPTKQLNLVSAVAAEVDRLVVRGHELAHEYSDKPQALAEMTALPHLLSTAAIVLLARRLTRDDVKGILPFTPISLVDGLIDNNIAEGIVREEAGSLELTEPGRATAEAMVAVQEDAVVRAWSPAPDDVATIVRIARPVVDRGRTIAPLRTPSNFALFAPLCDRPTAGGVVLRTITALRYWRADAHIRAIDDAGLDRAEAHALNHLWDASRSVERVGQGFPNTGRKAVASLEGKGLAADGTITTEGVRLRIEIEEGTDRLTASLYDAVEDDSFERLLAALKAVPGDASPGIPAT